MSPSKHDYLAVDALRQAGIDEPWTFGISDSVRFSELDILNHANNAAFVSWLENARISYFVNYGISDYVSEDRPTLVVRNLEIDFRAPLHLGAPYVVTARSVEYGRTSWRMEHAIFNRGKIASMAECTIVVVDRSGAKPVPLPKPLIETISERDGARKRI